MSDFRTLTAIETEDKPLADVLAAMHDELFRERFAVPGQTQDCNVVHIELASWRSDVDADLKTRFQRKVTVTWQRVR